MTTKPVLLTLGALMLVGLGGLVFARANADRPDCPGKIECPLTGEIVCRDQCPLMDPNRDDCPGRIACPLTGELVCRDRCPLESDQASSRDALAPCCRK